MKRVIFSFMVVFALLAILAVPAFAVPTTTPTGTHSQNWKLDHISSGLPNSPSPYVMQNSRYYNGQTGSVSILTGNFAFWIADQPADGDVTFPDGRWDVDLKVDANFANFLKANEHLIPIPGDPDGYGYAWLVQVGDYNPTNGVYSPFSMYELSVTNSKPQYGIKNSTIVEMQGPAATVLDTHYLAIRVLNPSSNTLDATIYTGLQPTEPFNLPSCVTSPQTDPGYPTPEIAAGILLGAGVLGAGGFILLRRKDSLSKT
jgi:hypothetical protein